VRTEAAGGADESGGPGQRRVSPASAASEGELADSVFPVEVSSRGETLGQTRYLLSIIRDITERKRAQEAHQRAELERERLLATTQHALAMREEFLWVASHELRTPLTVVSLLLHQLRRSLDRGDPLERLAASTDTALSHVERLSALVQRLLEGSQLEGGPRLDLTDVGLAEVARAAVERVRAQSDAAGIEITLDVPAILGRWDAVRLEQVLMNLLSNAVKYGLRQPIRIAAYVAEPVVHIEVIDHGIGLAASETERIFGKFERAVSTAHYGGLGLGLYIARQIVEAHRGWIAVDSAPGRGSTFRVTLPLRAGEPKPGAEAESNDGGSPDEGA